MSLGIPFLKSLLSPITIAGEMKKGTIEENKYARRYTVGGLHMAVLDELREKKMIQEVKLRISSQLMRPMWTYRPSYAQLIFTLLSAH